MEANNIQNAELFKTGLSNKNETLQIQIGDSSATLHPSENKTLSAQEFINLTSLDEFVEKQNIQKIDFIKVDIDGHEPLFMEGAWRILYKFNPIILLEVNYLNHLEAGYNACELDNTLKIKIA